MYIVHVQVLRLTANWCGPRFLKATCFNNCKPLIKNRTFTCVWCLISSIMNTKKPTVHDIWQETTEFINLMPTRVFVFSCLCKHTVRGHLSSSVAFFIHWEIQDQNELRVDTDHWRGRGLPFVSNPKYYLTLYCIQWVNKQLHLNRHVSSRPNGYANNTTADHKLFARTIHVLTIFMRK